ncbi:hypothetical protein JY97_17700 [Alkalispirochaeta odontotermitis]|nr:hypothetical protein JY97_17700 [Alkalispirochaeta odontotermitis]CAB1078686.1 hypothetical protein D1AOALGA4SA_6420 [Olavius algarvensis Delta 1 endosymbiont]
MSEFQKEIVLLIDKLEKAIVSEESSERITLNYLKGLAASEKAGDKRALEMGVADLEQFWVTSVNWCSELSKDIEKIIILYREQS